MSCASDKQYFATSSNCPLRHASGASWLVINFSLPSVDLTSVFRVVSHLTPPISVTAFWNRFFVSRTESVLPSRSPAVQQSSASRSTGRSKPLMLCPRMRPPLPMKSVRSSPNVRGCSSLTVASMLSALLQYTLPVAPSHVATTVGSNNAVLSHPPISYE